MCASNLSAPSDSQSKKHKKLHKALKEVQKVGLTLPKTGAELERVMNEALNRMPLQDAVVMAAGFYAGWNSVTPMTMLLSGFKGAADIQKSIINFSLKPPIVSMMGISDDEWAKAMKSTLGITIDVKPETYLAALEWKAAMACIGLIEGYMMTRPGALSGTLAFIGQMAQATAAGIDALIPG